MAVIQLDPPLGLAVSTSRGKRDFGDSESSEVRASLEVRVENLDETPKFVRLSFEGHRPDKPGKLRRKTITHGRFSLVKKGEPRDAYFRLQKMQWHLTEVFVKARGVKTRQPLREPVTDFNVSEPFDWVGTAVAMVIFVAAVAFIASL
ncbi:MAG: hypothetical protein ACFB6R_13195 [Alphaproteobacteria bacterium]